MHEDKPDIFLYGTLGCHLCDEAMILGKSSLPSGVIINKVDIVEDEALLSSMATRIPVMKMGDVELNWPFERQDIQRVWRQKASKRRYLR